MPSYNDYGLINKGMLDLSCTRQLYSIEVDRAQAARKNTFLWREQFICGSLGGWGKGCWGGQSYCPPTNPGIVMKVKRERKGIYFKGDLPPGSLAN